MTTLDPAVKAIPMDNFLFIPPEWRDYYLSSNKLFPFNFFYKTWKLFNNYDFVIRTLNLTALTWQCLCLGVLFVRKTNFLYHLFHFLFHRSVVHSLHSAVEPQVFCHSQAVQQNHLHFFKMSKPNLFQFLILWQRFSFEYWFIINNFLCFKWLNLFLFTLLL